MRIATLLRVGTLALALSTVVIATAPAFAASAVNNQTQAQNSGSPYDDAASEAAKRAFY
jgi:hypothetical protein